MSTIDDIKQRLDIVDVISSYLKLQKAGRNFKALCPFHQEKTPSFFIFPERQSWRCFGCGAGGDLFSFIMKKEGTDFGETLKTLADKAGVSLERKKETVESKTTDRLYQINEAAAQYYHNLLLRAPAAEHAREYVVNKRGLTNKTMEDFQLGFSPGEGLKKHLLELGYSEKELLTARLLGEKEGRIYDLFRYRLMFPIRDIKGGVVGFGARALDESMPKYLNSPQTAIFDKSSILYAIDRAKGAIKEKGLVVIVEGYMDVITAHQYGFTNVVASMGTALTNKQIKVLKGLTKVVSLALDPDSAGIAATERGGDIARTWLERADVTLSNLGWPTSEPKGELKRVQGLAPETSNKLAATSKLMTDIRIITLPRGKDPDSLIRDNPQAWQQLVDHAMPLIEHFMEVTKSRLDLTKPEDKSRASQQLLPLIAELNDEVQREFYLGKLSSLLGIGERTLVGMAAHLHSARSEKVSLKEAKPSASAHFGDRLEEYCLCLLLQHPELRDKAKELEPEYFERSENREIFIAWRNTLDFSGLLEVINNIELQEHAKTLCEKVLPPVEEREWAKALIDCMRRLGERRLINLKIQEESLLSDAESEGRSDDIAILQQRGVEINLKLKETFENALQITSANKEDQ
jgi:DNA primase